MKKIRWKYVVWLAIGALIVGGATVAIRGSSIAVETGRPTLMTVYEYIAEDGKTRLADTYLVDMPISGTIEAITLEVGDIVKKGDLIAQVESYPIEQRVRELESMIAQSRARVSGVDASKPKESEIESAVSKRLNRGSIVLTVRFADSSADAAAQINSNVLESYLKQLMEVPEIDHVSTRIDLGALLSLPAVIVPGTGERILDRARPILTRLVASACDGVISMRAREG